MSHFHKLWKIHTLNAILWHTMMIVMLLWSFWYLICMIWGILPHVIPEYVFLPESRTLKTQIRWFLKIWQEPGLGTKLKICAKGYRTIIKHNIEGTFHGQIQPISWRTKRHPSVPIKFGCLEMDCVSRSVIMKHLFVISLNWSVELASHVNILYIHILLF